jgi:AcrR family transcriptional regulator
MGRKERREREQQELKQSIMDAAREIARAEGWRNVTMRKIAERIEYSHAAIYEYFANKDVLLLALVREGFRLLGDALQRPQTTEGDPEEVLLLIGRGYLAFAERNPELYQVMFGLDGVTFGPATHEEGQKMEDIAAGAIKALLEAHGWPVHHLSDKVNILWSTVHGLVTLVMAGRIEGGKERAQRLLNQVIHDTLLAWEHDAHELFIAEGNDMQR